MRCSVSECKGVGEDAQTRVDARGEEWHAGTLLTRTRRRGAAAGAKKNYGDAREWGWLVCW